MKFRSVDGIYLPDGLDRREMWHPRYSGHEHEGTFYWARVRHHEPGVGKPGTGIELDCLRALMPYWEPRESDWHTWHFLTVVPTGMAVPAYVTDNRPVWQWDGNREKPTLSPSIGCGPRPDFHWHGYLKAGRFEACE